MEFETSALRDFGAAWGEVEAIPGWLTHDQGYRLWRAVRDAPPAPVVVEIGSHQGRSTLCLAGARGDVLVVAVDPFVRTRRYAGPEVRQQFDANLSRRGVADRVSLMAQTSASARSGWRGEIDVLFIDGKHDVLTVRDDLRWAIWVRPAGVILVHDAFSSVGVTLGLLAELRPASRLVYRGRTGSLAEFTPGHPTMTDRARLLRELPWFTRNVIIKVLLRLRARPIASLLGHHGLDDPF